jgi:hypothetical protein
VGDPSLRGNLGGRAEKAARREKAAQVEAKHVRPLLPQAYATEAGEAASESALIWSEEAESRLERVPEGFMRDASRERIEGFALRGGHSEVTLEVVEAGLAEARHGMAEAMQSGGQAGTPKAAGADPEESKCDMPWDPQAEAVLERVPEGFMRNLTAQRTEARAQRLGHSRITREVVEEQFASWQKHSEQVMRSMVWEAGAYELIAGAPAVVRGMIVREIEAGAEREGLVEVTTEYVEAARAEWRKTGTFHVAPTQEY